MAKSHKDEMRERLLEELREVRPTLYRMDGVLVTPKAADVIERTGAKPSNIVRWYRRDDSNRDVPELIGYQLSERRAPSSETSIHAAFDPELGEVVVYEEW